MTSEKMPSAISWFETTSKSCMRAVEGVGIDAQSPMRLHGQNEQKARHRKGTAHKSDKAMLADAAVGERLLTADKHIGGTTGKRAAGKTGVLGARLITVLADRPGGRGVEHGQVGNGARL